MNSLSRWSLWLSVCGAAAGCSINLPLGNTDGGAQAFPATRYADASDAGSIVSGYVWDPELYFTAVQACGLACPIPPLVMPGIPHFEGATIEGAQLSLFDPIAGAPAHPAASPTPAGGSWNIPNVPRREVPFFPMAVTPFEVSDPVTYLPTMTLRPVATVWSHCVSISALQISAHGILDALAQHLGVDATDFVDPAQYGGVGVFWLFQPGGSSLRLGAGATKVDASAGTAYHVDWATPGSRPPADNQSARGFYVSSAGHSAAGITVIVLPPLSGPPAPITFTLVDTVTSAPDGRPWTFPPLPPMVLGPGVISFAELQALLPGAAGAPPSWLCLPQ